LVAKPHGHQFKGNLVVMIDSGSASCSEVFARVVQLEKRGKIIGDRSAGAVMESTFYPRQEGLSQMTFYAVQVTIGNLILTDGKSLEKNPVTPDELTLPTPEDLAVGRDPVLSRALELSGTNVSSESAGKLFPHVWRRL
jgi:C-terminal processing protease CtpA/Prc